MAKSAEDALMSPITGHRYAYKYNISTNRFPDISYQQDIWDFFNNTVASALFSVDGVELPYILTHSVLMGNVRLRQVT